MKKLLIVLLSLFCCTSLALGAEKTEESNWKMSATGYKTIASDPEAIVQSGSGLKINLHYKSLYAYVSQDINPVRFIGQGGADVKLSSVGIGTQRSIGDFLTVSLDVGWYQPDFKEMGEAQDYMSSPFAEGLGRYLNLRVPDIGGQGYYPQWEYYTLEYHGAIGGKLGLDFAYPITEKLSFDLSVGYKYLKLLEHITGQDYDGGLARLGEAGHWSVRYERDFGGWQIGAKLEYKF